MSGRGIGPLDARIKQTYKSAGTQCACASGIPANQRALYREVAQTKPDQPLSGRRLSCGDEGPRWVTSFAGDVPWRASRGGLEAPGETEALVVGQWDHGP